MTPVDLPAIKARAEKAAPGPWRPSLLDGIHYDDGSSSYKGGAYPDREGSAPIFLTLSIDANDAEFIAHARTDIPDLVAEVERLRDVIEQVRAEVDPYLRFMTSERGILARGVLCILDATPAANHNDGEK